MSKYTTEVRFICENYAGYDSSKDNDSVDTVIEMAREKVFNFDFPMFDENYRGVLEHKILKHYYTREIGEETVGLWKLRLNTRLNEVMPYFNKLYESETFKYSPLFSTDLTTTHIKKNDSNSTSNANGFVSNSGVTESNGSDTNGSTSYNKFSDTPQGSLRNVQNDTYLTNATMVENGGNSSSNNVTSNNSSGTNSNTNTFNGNDTESYVEHVSGYNGWNGNKLLVDYRNTLLNIDMMIIDKLEDLFMNIW